MTMGACAEAGLMPAAAAAANAVEPLRISRLFILTLLGFLDWPLDWRVPHGRLHDMKFIRARGVPGQGAGGNPVRPAPRAWHLRDNAAGPRRARRWKGRWRRAPHRCARSAWRRGHARPARPLSRRPRMQPRARSTYDGRRW